MFCKFNNVVTQIVEAEVYNPVFRSYYHKDTGWDKSKEEEIIDIFKSMSFFKRFARSVLKIFLPAFHLKILDKDSLLFSRDKEVLIVAEGSLIVNDHRGNFEQPKISAYYKSGDLIGTDHLENNLSNKPDIWFISQTKIEYISMDKK